MFFPPAAFTCPDTLQYQACLTACTSQSCPNHDLDSDPDQCSGLTEGCVCPEGTLLHRPYSALCISPEKCGETLVSVAHRGHSTAPPWQHVHHLITTLCPQPAPTAPAFPARTARFGKPQKMGAACTSATTTPLSPWSTTAPVWPRRCAIGQER